MQVVGSREMRCPENDRVTAGDAMRYDMILRIWVINVQF